MADGSTEWTPDATPISNKETREANKAAARALMVQNGAARREEKLTDCPRTTPRTSRKR